MKPITTTEGGRSIAGNLKLYAVLDELIRSKKSFCLVLKNGRCIEQKEQKEEVIFSGFSAFHNEERFFESFKVRETSKGEVFVERSGTEFFLVISGSCITRRKKIFEFVDIDLLKL